MDLLYLSLFILHLLYLLFNLVLWYGWRKIPLLPTPQKLKNPPFVSVIIAVRNEEKNIPGLLSDLAKQGYTNFEVILVDDHSTDDTYRQIQQNMDAFPHPIRLLSLEQQPVRGLAFKKAGIALGIQHSQGELLLTTDADCRVGPNWLQGIANVYQHEKARLLSGGVCFHQEKNLFEKLQTVEFLSLIGSGAASMAFQKPNMCNGANLAYTAQSYREVNGFEAHRHIPSGDDEFLMHSIHARYPGSVQFVKSRDTIVWTRAKPTLREFIRQRKRWGSKWKHYHNPPALAMAVLVFAFHLSFILCWGLLLSGYLTILQLLSLLLIKFTGEFLFLSDVLTFFGKKHFRKYLPLLTLLHPFYIVSVGLLGSFGSYQWKGRQHTSKK
ncbi:glycosyltransferase [Rapidithrix thailandica]|uniref:Glycosyltransferase n=1 Tax=Rapidithrix thailandica TaxID=413964 RepID=A0AAW9S380_9BACT